MGSLKAFQALSPRHAERAIKFLTSAALSVCITTSQSRATIYAEGDLIGEFFVLPWSPTKVLHQLVSPFLSRPASFLDSTTMQSIQFSFLRCSGYHFKCVYRCLDEAGSVLRLALLSYQIDSPNANQNCFHMCYWVTFDSYWLRGLNPILTGESYIVAAVAQLSAVENEFNCFGEILYKLNTSAVCAPPHHALRFFFTMRHCLAPFNLPLRSQEPLNESCVKLLVLNCFKSFEK